MARRYAMNPDYLQSIPRKTRQARTEAMREYQPARDGAQAPTKARKHAARVLGAAIIASLLAFFLAVSPGENPDLQNAKKALAKIQTIPDNPNHSLTNSEQQTRKRKNEQRKISTGYARNG